MTDWNPDEFRTVHDIVRLADGAETLLAKYDDFLEGEHDAIPESELDQYVEETELTANLAKLEEELRDLKTRYQPFTTKMDADAAVAVRRHFELTRAQASDSGIWHALSILYFPWFVDYRWEYNGVSAMKKKYWTQGTALDSVASTFERLWWIAELTRRTNSDGSADYTLTRRAFDKRRFVFRVFDIKMGRYKPAVEALLEVLYDEPDGDAGREDAEGGFVGGDVIDKTVEKFLKSGSTFPYECQTKNDLVGTLREIRAEAEDEID